MDELVETHLKNATKPVQFVEFDDCYFIDPKSCQPITLKKAEDANETL